MKTKDNIYRILRNCLGLSAKEMAERCGLSAVYYSELERGIKKSPSDSVLRKIANTCDIPKESLIKLLEIEPDIVRRALISSFHTNVTKIASGGT